MAVQKEFVFSPSFLPTSGGWTWALEILMSFSHTSWTDLLEYSMHTNSQTITVIYPLCTPEHNTSFLFDEYNFTKDIQEEIFFNKTVQKKKWTRGLKKLVTAKITINIFSCSSEFFYLHLCNTHCLSKNLFKDAVSKSCAEEGFLSLETQITNYDAGMSWSGNKVK